MKARVTVTLKTGVLDPQGKAIEGALRSLGVEGVASVRQGKVFDIELDTADKAQAEACAQGRLRAAARQHGGGELPGRDRLRILDGGAVRAETRRPA
jgi:phosphoribosylformylglycinamidine synthase